MRCLPSESIAPRVGTEGSIPDPRYDMDDSVMIALMKSDTHSSLA